jgi:replication factor A3
MPVEKDSHLTVGNAIEIVCKVNSDLSVKVLKSTDMGNSLGMSLPPLGNKMWKERREEYVLMVTRGTDFKAVSAVVDATHRYKEIFYAGS